MLSLKEVDLDLETTLSIVHGMREIAFADAEYHQEEAALIDGFIQELHNEHGDIYLEKGEVQLEHINTIEKKMLFLQCLTYVALADQRIAEEELQVLQKYITSFQIDITPQDLIREIGSTVLTRYKGLSIFQEEAIALGKEFCLTEEEIHSILH